MFDYSKSFDEDIKMLKLKAMAENDNRTFMDLQDFFQKFKPLGNSKDKKHQEKVNRSLKKIENGLFGNLSIFLIDVA